MFWVLEVDFFDGGGALVGVDTAEGPVSFAMADGQLLFCNWSS
jgi:hypothetical protein